MKVKYSKYDFNRSVNVIKHILKSSDNEYRQTKIVPSENSLTFKNGFYVDITVLFVDIRDSKELTNAHTRPVLAKIYRAYISEIIAVMRGNKTISDVFIEGDGLWAVFSTRSNEDIQSVFNTAAEISSLIDILNIELSNKKYSTFDIGIGMEKGESLYIKAGQLGSSVNEIVWIGKVVGEAAKLCNYGNREDADNELMISEDVYSILSPDIQGLLDWNQSRQCYHANVINNRMNNWMMK